MTVEIADREKRMEREKMRKTKRKKSNYA